MVGRGIIGNPFLIKEISDYEKGITDIKTSYKDRIEMCLRHAHKLCTLKGELIGIREMRGLAPHYISGLYNSSVYKNRMSKLETYDDLNNLLREYELLLDSQEIYL